MGLMWTVLVDDSDAYPFLKKFYPFTDFTKFTGVVVGWHSLLRSKDTMFNMLERLFVARVHHSIPDSLKNNTHTWKWHFEKRSEKNLRYDKNGASTHGYQSPCFDRFSEAIYRQNLNFLKYNISNRFVTALFLKIKPVLKEHWRLNTTFL